MKIFRERLLEQRKLYGYTQRDMAERLGISQPSYVRYENGTSEPTQENLVKIADIFDVSTDYLLDQEYHMSHLKSRPFRGFRRQYSVIYRPGS